MRPIALAIPVVLAACSTTPEQAEQTAATEAAAQEKLEAALAGLTPGEPSGCLPVTQRTQVSTETYGSTIIYRVSDDLKFRNDTSGGCEPAARGSALITSTPSGRLCRGDIARTVDLVSRIPTGSCALGEFTPYRRSS